MSAASDKARATFVVPIEGLNVGRELAIGPVKILPSFDQVSIPANTTRFPEFEAPIMRSGEEHRAVATVKCESIDRALEIISQALSVLRVFQFGQMRSAYYSHFGLPGEIKFQKIFYFRFADDDGNFGFRARGLHAGFFFPPETIETWERDPLCNLVAGAIDNNDAPVGATLGLNAVLLFSQSIVADNPDVRVLLVVAALEGLLSKEGEGFGRYKLARRSSFLSCWKGGICGKETGVPCPYLLFDPKRKEDQKLLGRLADLGRAGPPWLCSDWLAIDEWYQARSGLAHGRPYGIGPDDARNFSYRIFHRVISPILAWIVEHPNTPVEDLDDAIGELRPNGVDWKLAVRTGVMPKSWTVPKN